MWIETRKAISFDLFKGILDSTHMEGHFQTVYSIIYDLTHGKIHIYQLHDYDNGVILNLNEELEKGKRTINLRSLFISESRQ